MRHFISISAQRERRFRREFLSAGAQTELRASDILLVDVPGSNTTALDPDLPSKFGLEELPLQGTYFMDKSQEIS